MTSTSPELATPHVAWAADAAALAAEIADDRLFGVYTRWLGMPEFPALPPLSSIDRADMARMWPNLVLMDVTEDGRLRYHATGPEVVVRLGRQVAGMYLDDVLSGSSLSVIVALYRLTAQARSAVYSRAAMKTAASAAATVVHRLMLPISNDRRRVDMILAAQSVEMPAGTQPDFTIGTMLRSEWNCQAWIDASQAAHALPRRSNGAATTMPQPNQADMR